MIRFIINPNAGKHKNLKSLEKDIKNIFPQAEIIYTKYAGNAKELALEASKKNYETVIAVGGDGTINEVVQGLVNSGTALGIIPCGSGNGFARLIKMPLKNNLKCLEIIKQNHTKKIDVGQLNNEYFLNVAGLGFDAIIAHKFATSKRRGKLPYFQIGIKEFFNFKAEKYTLTFAGGTKKEIAPMVLTVANGTQYGCDFHIAPKALLDDSFLDMVEIKPTNILKLLLGLPNFLKDGLTPVCLTETQKIKEIDIEGKTPFYYHIDGEPRVCESGKLKIKTLPKSLIILMPEQ
ncbi:MAG: diacylglycerol kinase family lipid kinase [Elusimicrobiaceae bacterium]|nr:diacylglycerol kinase family lipid kinase [Elusimicrobiaceae bacterium]